MRVKRQVAFLLAAVLIFALAAPGPAVLAAPPSNWAVAEMNAANMEGLLTGNAAKDFRRELTRLEFCELVVVMAEKILGQALPLPNGNPFTDCYSAEALKAYQYGIVEGVGNAQFAPDRQVQRQQLVTMMIRAVRKLEQDLGRSLLYSGSATLPFRDNAAIESYAAESVRVAYINGLVKGDDLNNFNPRSSIKSEECVAIVIRGYDKMQTTLNAGLSQSQLVDKTYENLTIGLSYGDTPSGVSQAVLLPTFGAGGAAVTWSSSNSKVISAAGAVNTGGKAVSVTLTATIRLGSSVRTKAFTLITSPYSGDRLLVENAYTALDIYYRGAGDTADSVTADVALPRTVLGLPVTWKTGNASVVTTDGRVIVPKDNSTLTATLTATFGKGAQTKAKTFTLKVQNPLYHSRSVSLHSIALGMTYSEVTARLGTPRRAMQTASNETWNVFHTNYSGFIAVAFQNSKVAAVYSMASTASNQLRGGNGSTVITVAQADAVGGVTAKSYADPGNANKQYALMIADNKSTILSSRTLTASGIEAMMFEFTNAYRALYGRTALTWNDKLAASARLHSAEMGTYNYFSHTGRNGSTYQSRAGAQGYESHLVGNENLAAGQTGPFEMLNGWVASADHRNSMLAAGYTVMGVGFSGGHTGTYRTYCVQVFGTLIPISSVSSPTSVAVGANSTQNVSLVLLPSGYNEALTVASSNTGIFTVTGTSNSQIYTVRGIANGTAYLTVRGNTSGASLTIPVTVGNSAYATGMTLSGTYLVGTGDTLQLTPALTPANGPVISWTTNSATYATVTAGNTTGTTGLVKGVRETSSGSPVTITASVQKNSTDKITQSAFVYVGNFSIAASGSTRLDLGGTNMVTLSGKDFSANLGLSITSWTSSNPAVATVNSNGIVTGASKGTAVITATATRNGWGGSITRTISITVTGTVDYPTDFTVFPDVLVLGKDRSTADVTTTFIPSDAKNKSVTYSIANEAVAKITGSRVEMVGPGATTLTAEVPLAAAETYRKKTVPIYGIGVAINPLESTIINHRSWLDAAATVDATPAIAPQLTVAWISSNPAVAAIATSGGQVRIMGESPGTADITVTVSYGGVRITSDAVTVTVQPQQQPQAEPQPR